eukprot:TRINITY_DN15983_c0_g1_i1.p2 TRINITY_DN15983_c0_g1~~TRINITY_DN15983_c0_g1_i1.p2  ORF type:complete len:352 (+),score=98.40 TRINITY_DN15983_c0_g1_i1:55-1110(+)
MAGSLSELVVPVGGVVASLDRAGVAVVRGVLPPAVTSAALAAVTSHRASAEARVASGFEPKDRWFSQRYPFRDDVLLPCELPDVRAALHSTLSQLSGALMDALGEGASLIELAAHVSMAGAAPQSFHTDHPWTPNRQVVSCFAALCDVTADMGPTEVYPGSHTDLAHSHCDGGETACPSDRSTCLRSAPVPLTLAAGDVALMDARVLHRGGSRLLSPASSPARTILYVTAQREGTSYGDEHSPSLLPQYAGRMFVHNWDVWTAPGGRLPPAPRSRVALWIDDAREQNPQGGRLGEDLEVAGPPSPGLPSPRDDASDDISARTPPSPDGVEPCRLPGHGGEGSPFKEECMTP